VNAMQDVTGANTVQSMHHWQVTPMVGDRGHRAPATDNDTTYEQTLAHDMARRSDAQLQRILSVMAESAGGRQLLFGAPSASTPQPADQVLRAALDARLHGGAQSMLDSVRAQVITPQEHGGRETAGDGLRGHLRTMGIYLAAPASSPVTAGPVPAAVGNMTPAHANMTPAGANMTPAGANMTPAGANMTPASAAISPRPVSRPPVGIDGGIDGGR